MIEYLQEHNVLINLIWEPQDSGDYGRNYQIWLNKIRRTHSQLVYTQDDGGLLKGYSEKSSTDVEPLAIHIRNELGDGIYFFHNDVVHKNVYFLIVNEMKIISGSDKLVSQAFFEELISNMQEGEFAHLKVKALSEEWLERVAKVCQQRHVVVKRKQKLFAIGVAVAGTAILVIMSILLNMMLS